MKIIFFVALLLSLSVAHARSDAAKPLKSTTGAMLRSLVVPGWGQLYNGQPIKAAAYFITEGILVASISRQHDRMMAAKHYDPPQIEDEQFYRNSRNKLIWWLSAVVLLSLGDAYVDAHMYGLDVSPDLSWNDSAAGLTASYRF